MTQTRKPDFEIEIDQEQLTVAVGDYCVDRLRRIPSGTYESTQVSIITDSSKGTLRVVFRAWAPPGMLGGPFKISMVEDAEPAAKPESEQA